MTESLPQFGNNPGLFIVNPWANHFALLAPYIFCIDISNRPILKLANGKVTFRYFASETGKPRTCTVPVTEFIRRFLQHVLPKGFV